RRGQRHRARDADGAPDGDVVRDERSGGAAGGGRLGAGGVPGPRAGAAARDLGEDRRAGGRGSQAAGGRGVPARVGRAPGAPGPARANRGSAAGARDARPRGHRPAGGGRAAAAAGARGGGAEGHRAGGVAEAGARARRRGGSGGGGGSGRAEPGPVGGPRGRGAPDRKAGSGSGRRGVMRATVPPAGTAPVWETARGPMTLERPRILGILNVTPASVWDGGRHGGLEAAVAHAAALIE